MKHAPKRLSAQQSEKPSSRSSSFSRTSPAFGAVGGMALDGAVKSRFDQAFEMDFSSVRVHADEPAARSASALGATAYTVGKDIFFALGRYRPDTARGAAVLAHELAHVIQQRPAEHPDRPLSDAGSEAEHEAASAAKAFARGEVPRVAIGSQPAGVYRQTEHDEPNLAILKNPKPIWDLMVARNIVQPAKSPGGDGWEFTTDDALQLSMAIIGVARDLHAPLALVVTTIDTMLARSREPLPPPPHDDEPKPEPEPEKEEGKHLERETNFGVTVPSYVSALNPRPLPDMLNLGQPSASGEMNLGSHVALGKFLNLGGNVYGAATVDAQGVTPAAGAALELQSNTDKLSTKLGISAEDQPAKQQASSVKQYRKQQTGGLNISGRLDYKPTKDIDINAQVDVEKSSADEEWGVAAHVGATISIDALAKFAKKLIKRVRRRLGR